jgi:iron complex outermembrane recepter protein
MRATTRTLAAGVTLGCLAGLPGTAAQAQSTIALPEVSVTSSRLGSGIVGTSTSVITAEEIERSPGTTIQDVLASQPGIQTQSLFGGVNGAQGTVDLRGFGAFASQNTLVMINGRRINDLDLDQVNFSSIPKNSIERIEITRGNSGAVLYGDNAVGGVINIVTKSPVGAAPSGRIETAYGSFNQREVAGSANASNGPWSVSAYGNALASDGWRDNNKLSQNNGVGELRYNVEDFSAFLNITGDDQHLGFPGARSVNPSLGINQLATDPRGATTPFNYGNRQGFSVTTGLTRQINDGLQLIVDGGVRQKKQQAAFFDSFSSDFDSYVDTTLTNYSFTPRVIVANPLMGMPSKLISGLDVNRADYNSDRPLDAGLPPVHRYDLAQTSQAVYAQETLGIRADTDLSFGGRLHHNNITARDHFDPNVALFPNPPVEGQPLDKSEYQYALHGGLEHRFNDVFTGFGRVARAFRYPNVDERVGMAPYGTPTNFDLKTQTSHDAETGIRMQWGRFNAQSSVYVMDLKNEIHLDPVNLIDTNLDPTRRYGGETAVGYRLSETVRLKGGWAYTRAVFREGPYAGHDVPLVSRWTASAGVSWDIWQKWLTLDATLRYVGPRRMDNDNTNVQPLIPSRAVLDLRLGGEVDKLFWSVTFQNAFTSTYYDYAIASAFTPGSYNTYPLPGRTVLARAGMKF